MLKVLRLVHIAATDAPRGNIVEAVPTKNACRVSHNIIMRFAREHGRGWGDSLCCLRAPGQIPPHCAVIATAPAVWTGAGAEPARLFGTSQRHSSQSRAVCTRQVRTTQCTLPAAAYSVPMLGASSRSTAARTCARPVKQRAARPQRLVQGIFPRGLRACRVLARGARRLIRVSNARQTQIKVRRGRAISSSLSR